MKYWQYPSNYYWSAMIPIYGSAEASRLMKDLGLPVNLNMDYSSCDFTKASFSRVPVTFARFGYPTPNISVYNYFTLKAQITLSRPVILYGTNKTGGWWIWTTYADGHAWVCDGFEEWQYYTCDFDPNTPGEWIENYAGYDAALRMNWGWSGYFNGWYSAYGGFTPNGNNYNYNTQMIIDIRKP
jgi:hypothetical protein